MTCFLPSLPLRSSFPDSVSLGVARQTDHAIRFRKALLRASLKPPITATRQLIPPQAAEIVDPTAQSMLNSLSVTPLSTSLCPDTIPTTHVTQSHPSRNPALVFLHGFDSSLLEFRRLHSVLSSEAPTTLHYVDILGWGLTSRPSAISYGPCAKREHLKSFLDTFEPDKPVILVGASLGAAIAVDFALAYPERISKIILIDGQVYMDRPKTPIPRFLASVGADVLQSRWLRTVAVQMSYHSDEFKCEDVLNISRLHCGLEGWKDAMIDFIMGEGYCVSQRVVEVKDKSFVIWGEHDRVLPRGDLKRFRGDGFPVVVARGCGHSPHIEDPIFVAEQIYKVLNNSG